MSNKKITFLNMSYSEKHSFINGNEQPEPIQTNELITSSSENNTKDHERIEELRKRIEETNREINRVEAETARTTATFNQIAEHCKIEWFRPEWIERPNANHLQEINYWLR